MNTSEFYFPYCDGEECHLEKGICLPGNHRFFWFGPGRLGDDDVQMVVI